MYKIRFILIYLFLLSCHQKQKYDGEMILIRGGSFMMGSAKPNEAPLHRVNIKDFYISKTEVTVGQYRKCVEARVCSKADSCLMSGQPNWTDSIGSKENHPINCVDWNQARTFAKWIGGDLPSEAQWEYVATAQGQAITYPWGNAEPTCHLANYGGCINSTAPVCSTPEGNTAQGVCDMAGNVWEWILDESHPSYEGSPTDGQAWCRDMGICNSNTHFRGYRGASWHYSISGLRSAARNSISPNGRYDGLGFRVVSD